MIRIGLPKGRLLPEAHRFCAVLGIEPASGKLRYQTRIRTIDVSVYLLKPQDVARMLADNLLDLGLTGDEWLMEAGVPPGRQCLETRAYEAALCLLMVDGDRRSVGHIRSAASPYPAVARKLLRDIAPAAEILEVSGSSEALVPDFADACLDVVETGNTAALNSLVVRCAFSPVTTHMARSERPAPETARIVELFAQAQELTS